MRLLCGAELTATDRQALLGRPTLDGAFAERLAGRLATDNDVDQRRLAVLAWLARESRLEVRIAIPIDGNGDPSDQARHPFFTGFCANECICRHSSGASLTYCPSCYQPAVE
jgi:hypothetical protein